MRGRAAWLTFVIAAAVGIRGDAFCQRATYPLGLSTDQHYSSFNLADVDGDGQLDVLAASIGTDAFSVLLANSDGSFDTPTLVPSAAVHHVGGNGPRELRAADLDGDGDIDAAATHIFSSQVSIYKGNGDGTFQPGVLMSAGRSFPHALAAADVDGDGDVDLAVTAFGGVVVHVNAGNATFAVSAFVPVPPFTPQSIAAGDVNGDGALDLVMAVEASISENIAIARGRGDGTFEPTEYQFVGGTDPHWVALGDLDADADLDIVVSMRLSTDIAILLNDDAASFTMQRYTTRRASMRPLITDLDADGHADVVLPTVSGLTLHRGNGDGSLQPGQRLAPVVSSAHHAAVADVNGDGWGDLITAGGSTLSVLPGSDVMDLDPPVLSVPSTITVNADSGAGAIVTYEVSAADSVDPAPRVTCYPPSGSTFSVGWTLVQCQATDACGYTSTRTFYVKVKSASEQLADLTAAIATFELSNGLETTLLQRIDVLLSQLDSPGACGQIQGLRATVDAQTGRGGLSEAEAQQILGTLARIASILGC